MGKFELEMFDPPPDQEFICSICRCVMEDPQECPCGHVFCKDCIQRWLRSHNNCPNCREQCQQVKPVLPMVRNLINHLTIRCENHEAGCDKKVQLEYYDNHKQVCDYASVPCPNEGCDLNILRINMDVHNRVCDFHRDTCLKGCGISILRKEQAGHSCVLELKKKLEEQEQEKRSLKQKNEELQAKVDNLKFLCWRSRNYLKKNIHAKAPRTLHNLCVDLENATGLAPDNTEGHRNAAVPQAEPAPRDVLDLESDSGSSSAYESSPLRPIHSPSEYQSSPPRPLDSPSEYQSSPPRPLDSPSEYQSSPLRPLERQRSPPRPLDSSSEYQSSPLRPIFRDEDVEEEGGREANGSSPLRPLERQRSPPRPLDSSSEYQSSPIRPIFPGDVEEEEGREANGDRDTAVATVGDTDNAQSLAEAENNEAVEEGQAQPPRENRDASQQQNQEVDSTQANSRRTGNGGASPRYEESPYEESPYEESPVDSPSDADSEVDHRANLRHLLASDSDPTWSSPSEYQPSEGEESDTGTNVLGDGIIVRPSRNASLALRYGGGLRIDSSDNEEERPSAGTVQNSTDSTQQNSQSRSETAGERSPVVREQQGSHQENARPSSERAEDPEVVIAEDSHEEMANDEETIDRWSDLVDEVLSSAQQVTQERNRNRPTGVRGTPLVVRNFRNRHRGQRLQRSRTNQGQGNSRSRGASRPQRGSARSVCSSARQTVTQTRSCRRNTTPPVITIGNSDGNQSPNQQRAGTEDNRTHREGGASQQQRGSVQQTRGNENSTAEIVEINIPGAEEVTAGEVRTRRQTRALRRRTVAARRRPPAAQSTRRSGANARPLDSSGESDSESVPVAPKRPRRHNGRRN